VSKAVVESCLAGLALIVLAPVLLTVTTAIHLSLGAPVLIRQARPGLRGRPFTMPKFRTMLDAMGAELTG
jgi:lipopolysaccharide/colanic/teichoic acid biosynthesis glycosyltransferase